MSFAALIWPRYILAYRFSWPTEAVVFDFSPQHGWPQLSSPGVVLNSAAQREAKRGQSTNRKGEMRSRFS